MEDTLSNRLRDAHNRPDICLSNDEQVAMLKLFGSRCSVATKQRLAWLLSIPLAYWSDYGIYRRVEFADGSVHYCAGQSYPDEIRTVRQCLLGK